MTKSILGHDKVKRAFTLGTENVNKPPKIEQDSPKEDFILCDECEAYFCYLETYINERIHRRLWDVRKAIDFTDAANEQGVRWKICNAANPKIFQLFIFSLIWRVSISSTNLFSKLRLEECDEEGIRNSLLAYKSTSYKNLMEKIESNDVLYDLYFVLITAQTNSDPTRNAITHNGGNKKPYTFLLNEYLLFFSFSLDDIKEFQDLINVVPSNDSVKINFITEIEWGGFITTLFQRVTGRIIENRNKEWKKETLIEATKEDVQKRK